VAKRPTAKRYAQALFDLALGQHAVERWMDALRGVAKALDDPTVRFYFNLPNVPLGRKQQAAAELAPGADATVVKFLGLLATRRAITLLPDVTLAYGEMLNAHLGRLQATATSAVTLTKPQQEQLRRRLRDLFEKDVVLEARVDDSIIGGVVVRIGDQVIDGSVRTKLQRLKQRLAEGSLT